MSEKRSPTVKPIKIASKFVFSSKSKLLIKKLHQENVLIESADGGLFQGPPDSKLTILNTLNTHTSSSRTIAKLATQGGMLLTQKTSDKIAQTIGQKNYDLVFEALRSVLDQNLRLRAIMALLTENKTEDRCSQTEWKVPGSPYNCTPIETEEKQCQTEENCMDLIFKLKKAKKRIKRSVLTPYVVKDLPEKKKIVIVDPNLSLKNEKNNVEHEPVKATIEETVPESPLPVIHLNEESNTSTYSSLSNVSNDYLMNARQIINAIGEHTEVTTIKVCDSTITLRGKPEDKFHYATSDNLRSLNAIDRKKLLAYQAYIDFKYCLEEDEDGYLPIHTAVVTNDLELLRRQCFVLKNKQESLDIVANNMTPLQMSIFLDTSQCLEMLLQYGADPLTTDEEHKTCLHLAADGPSEHLRVLVEYCKGHARQIFENHSDLWKTAYKTKSDEELASILMTQMNTAFDEQGYTPLMLAARMGNYANVLILLEVAAHTVNTAMPNCGYTTALYLAVTEAHNDATNRGNKSSVADHFKKTLTFLLQNGADPNIENQQGVTVNTLLWELNNPELSNIVSTTTTSVKFFNGTDMLQSVMLLKDEEGNIVPHVMESSDLKAKKTDKAKSGATKNSAENSANKTVKKIQILDSKILPAREKATFLGSDNLKPTLKQDISSNDFKTVARKGDFVAPNTITMISPNSRHVVAPKVRNMVVTNSVGPNLVASNIGNIVLTNSANIAAPNMVAKNMINVVVNNSGNFSAPYMVAPNLKNMVVTNSSNLIAPNLSNMVVANTSNIVTSNLVATNSSKMTIGESNSSKMTNNLASDSKVNEQSGNTSEVKQKRNYKRKPNAGGKTTSKKIKL